MIVSWPALVLSLLLDRCGNQTGATRGAGGGLYLVDTVGVAKPRPWSGYLDWETEEDCAGG